MLNLRSQRSLVIATIFSLFVAIALPSVAFADQKRGRGRGQERRDEQRYDERYSRRDYRGGDNSRRDKKKAVKFINGHDARDGRWDKRGPGYNRSLYQTNSGTNFRRSDRNRRRDFNRYDQYRDQYRNDGNYNNENENYRETNYPQSKTDILVGILGSILGGQ